MGHYLAIHLKIKDKFKARAIGQALINSCFEYQKIKDYRFIKERAEGHELMYKYQNSYDIFIDFLAVSFENYLRQKEQYYEDNEQFIKFYLRNISSQFDYDAIVLGLAEAIGLVSYTVENGNSPQERIIKYTDFFWDKIEDYFLGYIPTEVEEKLYKSKNS